MTPEEYMVGKRRRQRRLRWWLTFAFAVGLLLVALLLDSGCTVTPAPVAAEAASYGDSGEQNSGFLRFVAGGAIIDAGARDRYNALIEIYGASWAPAITRDYGITRRDGVMVEQSEPGADPKRKQLAPTYFITNAGLQKFAVMNQWRRMGRKP